MEFVITEFRHCDLLQITGRLDSLTAPAIEKALKTLIADNRLHIVIDMENVSYISSSGILVFVNTQKQLKRQNRGELVIANISINVYSSFELAGFHNLFEFFEDMTTAVGKF